MKKILMVCLGNICRSPMAEGILRHLADKSDVDVFIDSAGTANYHEGEAPDSRAIACLRQQDIDISGLRARQFSTTDFDSFDLIFVMDRKNYQHVVQLARSDDHRQKVKLLAEEFPHRMYREVPDPYYGSPREFDEISDLLHASCKMLVERLKSH